MSTLIPTLVADRPLPDDLREKMAGFLTPSGYFVVFRDFKPERAAEGIERVLGKKPVLPNFILHVPRTIVNIENPEPDRIFAEGVFVGYHEGAAVYEWGGRYWGVDTYIKADDSVDLHDVFLWDGHLEELSQNPNHHQLYSLEELPT